jgi:hypothetical protein
MMYEHESKQPSECHVCKVPHFDRNNYFHGKMLSARDLAAEQHYFNQKRWLINRMVLGWGVVCGLEVRAEGECLYVTSGLALDCCGRELLVCNQTGIHANKIAEELHIDISKPFPRAEWALCLEYYEQKIEQVRLPSACDQGEQSGEYNRIRDHYRLSFRPRDEACPTDYDEETCPHHGLGQRISIHRAVVEQSRRCPECKDCECVLLATGTLGYPAGGKLELTLDQDYWKYRPVVYTNPALASLIRCFHGELAHIVEVNWEWGPDANYTLDEFFYLLSKKHLRVTFDKPMNPGTVTDKRTFRLSVFIANDERNCPVHVLIPVDHIEYYGNEAVYYFDNDCLEYDLRHACRRLTKPLQVELVLHGDMVHDQHERALDAELIHNFPTGNGVQGGDFVTYFTVGPRSIYSPRRLNEEASYD